MKLKISIPTLLLAAAFLLPGCKTEKKPEGVKSYTIAQFMDIVPINGGAFSPDESKILFNTRETGIFNAYEIDIKSGEKKQLTKSTDNSVFSQSYFPADDRVVYTSDKGGNEITHIFVRSNNGSINDIIPDSTAKAQFFGWSYDQKLMYYTSNSRDKRFFDVYKIKIDKSTSENNIYAATKVYENKEGYDPASISSDDRYIALVKTINEHNNDMYLLDTQTGKMKHLSPHEGDVIFNPQYFSLDGTKLFYTTDQGSEFAYLSSYDIATGEKAKVEEAPWDIQGSYISRHGKYRVTVINNDARTEIKIYDEANGGKALKIEGLPEGDVSNVNISDSEKLMLFFVSSSKSPANLFVYNFDTKEVKQLTNNMTKEIDQNDLVAGEVIRFKSFDGLDLDGLREISAPYLHTSGPVTGWRIR